MALHYTKKKDEKTENTADPWNIYGVNFGKENKSDSEKVAWELTTIREAPAEPALTEGAVATADSPTKELPSSNEEPVDTVEKNNQN